MKQVFFITVGLFMANFFLSVAHADDKFTYQCNSGRADAGHLLIRVANDRNSADIIVVDESANIDASGKVNCQGAQQNAYLCQGKIKRFDTNKTLAVSLVIPERLLSLGHEKIHFNNESYLCVYTKM